MKQSIRISCFALIIICGLSWYLLRPPRVFLNEKPFQTERIFGSLTFQPLLTLYVSPAGSDQHPGTRDAPFQSIQYALDRAQPGTTIRLLPGTYRGPLFLKRSGSSQHPIILEGSAKTPA